MIQPFGITLKRRGPASDSVGPVGDQTGDMPAESPGTGRRWAVASLPSTDLASPCHSGKRFLTWGRSASRSRSTDNEGGIQHERSEGVHGRRGPSHRLTNNRENSILDGYSCQGCEVFGPAVVVLVNDIVLDGITLMLPDGGSVESAMMEGDAGRAETRSV